MRTVHVVVPEGVDDPTRPSGGNTYDRHVCRELGSLGWAVHEHHIPGAWPRPDAPASAALADVVGRIPDGAVVLLDGLVASAAPAVLVPEAARLRLVVLVHMPLGHRPADDEVRTREHAVLSTVSAVITTSAWARRRLLELYSLAAGRVHVAEPGVVAAELAVGSDPGGNLLCVAAVTFDKGHDVLVHALEKLSDLSWRCVCVGSLERDPPFADKLARRSRDGALAGRLCFTGPRTGRDLDRAYTAADLLVLASRAETYGMVLTEALARGIPLIATDVGGVTEALGAGMGGTLPGLLVPPVDPAGLAAALRTWLTDGETRAELRRAARARREALPRWSATAAVLAGVMSQVSP